jgi:hypothetical protein
LNIRKSASSIICLFFVALFATTLSMHVFFGFGVFIIFFFDQMIRFPFRFDFDEFEHFVSSADRSGTFVSSSSTRPSFLFSQFDQ